MHENGKMRPVETKNGGREDKGKCVEGEFN
jgi:hypothetical protein